MALSPPLIEEWRLHQSKYTKEWRRSMYARKKVTILANGEDPVLRAQLLDLAVEESIRAIRLKDLPLIEAAFRTDRIVASLDERARTAFRTEVLRVIVWVNPVNERDRMTLWLSNGAEPVEEWRLEPRRQ